MTTVDLGKLGERKNLANQIARKLKDENQYTFREMEYEQLSNKILTILSTINGDE